jgi:hypothetical protein
MTEATASAPCCGNCRYSVVNQVEHRLTCNRYAPKAESCYGTGPRDTVGDYWAYWPSVSSADWCGEWASPTEVDLAPPTLQEIQALADLMAMTGPPPHGDTPPLPASDQQEAPPTTYDQFDQFEDPLA